MEEYYLSKYNVKNSPWLKLLLSIQHLGSDTSPVPLIAPTEAKDKNGKPIPPPTNPQYTPKFINTGDGTIAKYGDWSTDELSDSNVIPKILEDIKGKALSKEGTYKISKCMTLLLALSTRYDKLEGVTKTFEFADILTQITNPSCIEYLQT